MTGPGTSNDSWDHGGGEPDSPDWSSTSHTLAFLIDGSSAETGGTSSASDLYVAYNAYWSNLSFTIPMAPNGKCWWLLTDTADWAESNQLSLTALVGSQLPSSGTLPTT